MKIQGKKIVKLQEIEIENKNESEKEKTKVL